MSFEENRYRMFLYKMVILLLSIIQRELMSGLCSLQCCLIDKIRASVPFAFQMAIRPFQLNDVLMFCFICIPIEIIL